MSEILKNLAKEIGFEALVSWRAKELLATYRKIIKHYGGYQGVIQHSVKISKLRRNRALVKALGKQFADYIQVEFDLSDKTKVVKFPSWYSDYSQPVRERVFVPMEFLATDIDNPVVMTTNSKDYEITPTKFGNMNGHRMAAGYLPNTDTIYISDIWTVQYP